MKTLMLATVLVATCVSNALAAPPTNDDFDDATEISGLPFSDVVNTTEATTAADDPDCVGQGPTVWFVFTPLEDARIDADTFGSDYDTTLSVYTGTRGALNQLACNDDTSSLQSRVRFDAIAGETYFFMVWAFASGPGGTLQFSVDVAPPPLVIDLSVARFGTFSKAGEAIVSGSLTCSQPASANVSGTLRQEVGRLVIQGPFSTDFECEGRTAWNATVTSDSALFRGGKAKFIASASAFAPETEDSAGDQVQATIQLRGGGR
jgi:hypothetical protein